MITQKRQLGNKGERMARGYLISKGYSIIESNYNTKFGEIDIIAKYKGIIHFIEVKSGHNNNEVNPVENLNYHKIRKFIRITQHYLLQNNISDQQRWQIDAIVVIFGQAGEQPNISHIENINIL